MKKFILSASVVVAFVIYIYQRPNNDSYAINPSSILITDTPATNPDTKINSSIVSKATKTEGVSETKSSTLPKPDSTAFSSSTTKQSSIERKYKDGQYAGSVANAFYGYVQVRVVILEGKITNVQFLNYPQDRSTSRTINGRAMPYLISEAIQVQSANVDIVSGATYTSQAFRESLSSALAQAI